MDTLSPLLSWSAPFLWLHFTVLSWHSSPTFWPVFFLCPWQPSLSVIKLSFILILLYACMILTLSVMCCRTFKLLSLTLFAELQTCKYQRHLKLFNMSKTGSSVLPANTFLWCCWGKWCVWHPSDFPVQEPGGYPWLFYPFPHLSPVTK